MSKYREAVDMTNPTTPISLGNIAEAKRLVLRTVISGDGGMQNRVDAVARALQDKDDKIAEARNSALEEAAAEADKEAALWGDDAFRHSKICQHIARCIRALKET